MVFKYVHDKYPKEVSPTIEDSETCSININGKEYEQKIFMVSEDEYQTMLGGYMSTGDGFLLVFALDNYESFISLKSLYEKITKNGKNKYPIVLVGNKCEIPENERKVSKNEAEELAKNWGMDYFEVSTEADTNGNINLVFENITKKIIEFKGKQKPKPKQKSEKCYII